MKVCKVVDSTHEGTKWLIVYGVHICHKQRGQVENLQSALEMVKMVQVPFCHLMSSTGGQDGEVKVVQMTDPEGHRCSKDKTGVILHKFKLKLKERMQSTLDAKLEQDLERPVFICILFLSLVNHPW